MRAMSAFSIIMKSNLIIMLCLFIIIASFLVCSVAAKDVTDYHLYDDHMGTRDKQKLILLAEELMKEALLRMRQLYAIKDEHTPYTPFHIGLIIGKAREKYRYMLDLYQELLNKRNKRLALYPPGMKLLKPIHYIITLELVHYLELEIESLMHVLEEILPDLKTTNIQVGGPPDYRAAAEEDAKEERKKRKEEMKKQRPPQRSRKEEKQKSILRQKYLMKKLGMPSNMTTTEKRFLHQWPVEETWNLEKYNYY
ncbi:uncharacterized protein LOC118281255 isoform X4 [Spodoptera frugiperda]|uniref:Uncharacterized protein LOC118281255 isoform X4 n=1 Tax=Spodoptera frugiperda TaxID=7108 RepID=A0A9R0F1L7_SPOFR|nr:uncharacterized protein LOC118281255 isoform X4 [Spodoptera frugiperda]